MNQLLTTNSTAAGSFDLRVSLARFGFFYSLFFVVFSYVFA